VSVKRAAAGFTLLELTVALVLLALLSGVLFGSLSFAGRSWDAGEAKAAQVSEMRQTEQFLRGQLGAQFPLRARKIAEAPLFFSGASDEIRYAAALPSRVIEGGVYLFRLAVVRDGEKSRLVQERLIVTPTAARSRFPRRRARGARRDIGELKLGYWAQCRRRETEARRGATAGTTGSACRCRAHRRRAEARLAVAAPVVEPRHGPRSDAARGRRRARARGRSDETNPASR
jgi:prepilin-type N-terminal cleavage/methylation domain-containing protein